MARPPKHTPRTAVYASDAPLAVVGRVRSFGPMVRGAEVDLDAVVDHDGDGRPVTLAEALGPHVHNFSTGAPRAAVAAPERGDDEA